MKHLKIKSVNSKSVDKIATYLDTLEFHKVKTRYTKADDWTAISLRGYSNDPLIVTKPSVLKANIKNAKLQFTKLYEMSEMSFIKKILDAVPSTFERVRFMKLNANKTINKHTDKIDKDIGEEIGQIARLHVPIRTNDLVTFSVYEKKNKQDYTLKQGHYYYTDVRKAHSVENLSDISRYHLVIDTYVNKAIRELIL